MVILNLHFCVSEFERKGKKMNVLLVTLRYIGFTIL